MDDNKKKEREKLIRKARLAYRATERHMHGALLSYRDWLEKNCKYEWPRARFKSRSVQIESILQLSYLEALKKLEELGPISDEEEDRIHEGYDPYDPKGDLEDEEDEDEDEDEDLKDEPEDGLNTTRGINFESIFNRSVNNNDGGC